jgi:transcriptional regulator with XRE-family HTH domain
MPEKIKLFGPELRIRRTDARLSLAELSNRVHYSKSHLSKVENGLKLPSIDLARRCDAQLAADGALAALVPQTPPHPSPPDIGSSDGVWLMTLSPDGRSEFGGIYRREALAPDAAAFSWTARPTSELSHRGTATKVSFRTVFDEMRKIGQTVAPAAVIPMLVGQIHALRVMAPNAAPGERDPLLVLAARYAEYTGWMAQEAGNDQAALWWTEYACEIAEAGGFSDLGAYALVRQALVTMYQHDSRSTIELAQLAQEQTTDPRILGLAAQREAQGHALAGDYDACQRALDRAADLLSRHRHDEQPALGTSNLDDPASMVRGWCLHDLGRSREAIDVLGVEIARIPPDADRTKARYSARYALALAGAGDVEEACAVAGPVLELLGRIDSATIRSDLRRLSQDLQRRHGNPAVTEIAPLLATALRTARGERRTG